ncbi:MAG: PTS glucose transporter subunit IIA [Erysipelotrichaceae bacterium]|nr:PTS glucose transporter subunit IIA [Erysipelotrichaceae bacterium]
MFWKKKEIIFSSPVKGKLIPLSETPDEAFANKKLGTGFSIIPEGNKIVAPTDGVVMFALETNHAVAIRAVNGVQYLIHVGVNTYELCGRNFKCYVSAEKKVKKGETLIEFDLDFIKSEGYSTVTPVIFTNVDEDLIEKISSDEVEQGEDIFKVRKA